MDLVDAATGEVICKAGDKMTPRIGQALDRRRQGVRAAGPVRAYSWPLCGARHHQRGNRRDYVEAGEELTWELDRDGEVKGGTLKVLLDQWHHRD
jgi:DNA-directed RNA polymerase subunit beta